ncbi:MAG: hypothetical protein NVS3B20_17380 [Polyangiales bacterium]
MWSPSFDVIGTFEAATGRWTWGWADQTLDARVRTRIEAVKKQALGWGIDALTSGLLVLENEQQAWELSTVAAALSRADAMYRVQDGARTRFLALFDGPPPSRSASMRALQRSESSSHAVVRPTSQYPHASVPSIAPHPPVPEAFLAATEFTSAPSNTANPLFRRDPPATLESVEDAEPTQRSRNEIGWQMIANVPLAQRPQVSAMNLLVQAQPPLGSSGGVSLELRLTLWLQPDASPVVEVPLVASAALHEALATLFQRCLERNGTGYRSATVRLVKNADGFATDIVLEG